MVERKNTAFEMQGEAIRRFGELRKTPEGREQLKKGFEEAIEKYCATVRNEAPPSQRPEFQISPEDRERRIGF